MLASMIFSRISRPPLASRKYHAREVYWKNVVETRAVGNWSNVPIRYGQLAGRCENRVAPSPSQMPVLYKTYITHQVTQLGSEWLHVYHVLEWIKPNICLYLKKQWLLNNANVNFETYHSVTMMALYNIGVLELFSRESAYCMYSDVSTWSCYSIFLSYLLL